MIRVFYDGTCGLCHGFVVYLLKRDPDGTRFKFAPLFGPTFEKEVPPEKRAGLPDSVVVLDPHGHLLIKSDAALYALQHLGGSWPGWAKLFRLKPRWLRDLGYDAIAKTRRIFFRRPPDVCPVVPPDLRNRFDP